jgi:hypothetical protein
MNNIILAILLLLFVQAPTQERKPKSPPHTTEIRTPSTTATTHSAVLTWTVSNTCSDGSPCSAAANTLFRLVGTCQGSTPPTGFTQLATMSGTTRSYTDSGLTAATSYCYYVTSSLAQPPAWSSTVTYTGGQEVTYATSSNANQVWVALNSAGTNLNQVPPTSPTFWQTGTIESAPSNVAGGATGPVGPPSPPSSLTATVN